MPRTRGRLTSALLIGALLVPPASVPAQAAQPAAARPAKPAAPSLPCEVSALRGKFDPALTFANKGKVETKAQVTITKAESATTAAGTPYCRIDGLIVTEPANVNDVAFQVSLPTRNFNGRYFQAGQGGAGGSVQPPNAQMLDNGFASASTDRGAGVQLGLDFSQNTGLCDGCGFHVAAIAAQRVTKAFYASPSLVRYVSGCSAGGADGRGSALAYGTRDFDGVVTGANPFGPGVVLAYGRVVKYISDHPDAWIPPALLARVEARMIAKYDDADGARDGVIQDDRNFRLDDAVLREAGLSDAQIAAVRFISSPWRYDSPVVSATGDFPGFPVNRISQWSMLFGSAPPPWKRGQPGIPAGFMVIESFMRRIDPQFDLAAYTFDRMARSYVANNAAVSLDYSAFRDGGGKLIFYTGVGDPLVPYFELLAGFEQLNRNEGSPVGLDRWARLYLVPGMDHCAGPNGPSDAQDRLFDALIAWVEEGKAPAGVVASRPAGADRPPRSFLLCPEPRAAVYTKTGDVNDAANWRCELRAGAR